MVLLCKWEPLMRMTQLVLSNTLFMFLTALFNSICFEYVSASLFKRDTGVPVTSSICGPLNGKKTHCGLVMNRSRGLDLPACPGPLDPRRCRGSRWAPLGHRTPGIYWGTKQRRSLFSEAARGTGTALQRNEQTWRYRARMKTQHDSGGPVSTQCAREPSDSLKGAVTLNLTQQTHTTSSHFHCALLHNSCAHYIYILSNSFKARHCRWIG